MSTIRMTGMSGFDTESIVTQLMNTEKTRVARDQRKLTTLTWKQDAYRGYISSMQSFQKNFLSLGSTNSFRLSNSINLTKASATRGGSVFSGMTVTPGSKGESQFKLNVEQLATKSVLSTDSNLKNFNKVDGAVDFSKIGYVPPDDTVEGSEATSLDETSFFVNIDGNKKEIKVNTTAAVDDASLQAIIQEQLDKFGTEDGKKIASVSVNDGKISFETQAGHSMKIESGSLNVKDVFGIDSGNTGGINMSSSIKDALGLTGDSVKIGDKTIEISESMSVKSFMDKINASGAGATIKFNDTFGRFEIEAKETGVANSVGLGDISDNLKNALGLKETQTAQDAIVYINGEKTTRAKNEVEYEGAKVSFIETTGVGDANAVTIKSSKDIDSMVEKITTFINSYNELLSSITAGYQTSRPKSDSGSLFDPLTDEEKAGMSETEIARWEENAKTGILRGDSTLETLASKMRSAFTGYVDLGDGKKISLHDIGIGSTSWRDNGTLTIDEDKLRKALNGEVKLSDGTFATLDDITKLFSNSGSTEGEKGIAERLNSALDYAVSTSAKNTGVLVNLAGAENTSYNINNILTEQIRAQTQRVATLLDKLVDKENSLYTMFGRMEAAIMEQNNMMSYFTQGM